MTGMNGPENRNWETELERCTRCGKCGSVCVVFGVDATEPMSTRGRIALFQALVEGRLPKSSRLSSYLNSCLRCLRCISVCSAAVKYNLIQSEVRRRLIRPLSIPWLLRLALHLVLPSRRLSDRVASIWPGLFVGRLRRAKSVKEPALRRLANLPRLPKPRMRVALFLGCLVNYVYPEIAEALIKVLNWADIEVVVPQNQLCCGAPALALGDVQLARRLAENNLRVLGETGADYYVTPCALGASTFKIDYPDFWGSEARGISDKLFEFSEFAHKFIDLSKLERTAKTVTYHDPCHLRWAQGVEDAPRDILKRSSRYVEMEASEVCCGGGNLFALFRRDLSDKLAEEKLSAIRNTAAEVVATACPICMLQLETQLARAGVQRDVRHTAQILAEALPTEGSKMRKR